MYRNRVFWAANVEEYLNEEFVRTRKLILNSKQTFYLLYIYCCINYCEQEI